MCAMKKAQRQTSENAKLSLWQGFRSSIRNFPQIYDIQRAVVPIGEREQRMKRFFAFFLMEVAQGCVCEREKHLFVPDRMFPCPFDMLYNSLIPTIREIETKNHSSQSEQYHG